MDTELQVALGHVKGARIVMTHRLKRLHQTRERYSRYYTRVKHTELLIHLLEEVEEAMGIDPDMWDEEAVVFPF